MSEFEDSDNHWEDFISALKEGNLLQAEAITENFDEDWFIAESLCKIARQYHSLGQLLEANRVWNKAISIANEGENPENPQNAVDCASVLWEISEDFALNGDFDKAKEIIASIRNSGKRKRALKNLENILKGEDGAFQKIHSKNSYEN